MGILDELADHARERVEAAKQVMSLDEVSYQAMMEAGNQKAMAQFNRGGSAMVRGMETSRGPLFQFGQALVGDELSFICEIKKASPSKGVIAEDFPYVKIAEEYERAGADCISCLTEPKWFLGSDDIFRGARAAQSLPMIRKDFTVDEYQLYEAKLMGANAVLLIVSILDGATIEKYIKICDLLGIDALVETHDAEEIRIAVDAGARIIGVNNRNLKDFSVDFENAQRLVDLIPSECIYVAESGVKTEEDVAALAAMGADAVLVGEALMRDPFKGRMLNGFRYAATKARKEAKEEAKAAHRSFGHGMGAMQAAAPAPAPAPAPAGAPAVSAVDVAAAAAKLAKKPFEPKAPELEL